MTTNSNGRRQALWIGVWALAATAAHGADAPPAEPPATPFEHYQPWRDEPLRDWREVNDRVGQVGGWRTYLRESQPDDGGGMQHGHHDHHGHGQ